MLTRTSGGSKGGMKEGLDWGLGFRVKVISPNIVESAIGTV